MKPVAIFAISCLLTAAQLTSAADWTRFRGPQGAGHVEGSAPPFEWSSAKNLKWRTELPGSGVSSPVVVGDRVFLTAYTGYGIDMENPGDPKDLVRHLLAFDRKTGKEIWRASVPSNGNIDPYSGFITQHGYASSTPAVDGDTIYVVFGRSGLIAFDKDGKQKWQTDLGQQSDPARWGDGSSPIVLDDVLVVDAGILGNQFVGVDKRTGSIRWSVKDKKFTNCWATPTDVETGGKQQVLVHVPFEVLSLNPKNGEVFWRAPSPLDDSACGGILVNDGVAFLMGSRAGHALALRCDPKLEDGKDRKVWQSSVRAGIVTPVIVGERMYWLSNGIYFAASLKDGEYVYRERLPRKGGPTGGFPNADYSSPIAVGNKIIQFTRNGESYVIEAGDTFKLVSHNPPFEDDESAFSSTPAASDGELFIRSERFLYCIGK